MRRIIDNLTPGETVTLQFAFGTEEVQFVRITGTGEDRTASFLSYLPTGDGGWESMGWEAYRYNGHWAYGTGAEHLRLVES